MKKILLCTTLLLSLPAGADEAAKKPLKSDVLEALTLSSVELKRTFGNGKGNPIPLLDNMSTFEYSEETRAKLIKVFGHARPLSIARVPASKGKVGFDLALQAHRYREPDDVQVSWTPLKIKLLLDAAGRTMESSGSWSNIDLAGPKSTVSVAGIGMRYRQRRNADDIWLGKGRIDVVRASIGPTGADADLVMEGIQVQTSTVQRGKGYEVASDFRIKTISAGGATIDGVRMAVRATNLDMRALEALSEAVSRSSQGASGAPEMALLAPAAKTFGKTVAARGTALEIDEISAGYRGNRAVIQGRVTLAGAQDEDFASFAALAKKIVARFDVKVPVALITDVAGMVAHKQATAQAKAAGQSAPMAMPAAGQSISDMIVGRLLNGGFARLEKGVLVTVVEWKQGQLSANGKAVPMPARPQPAAVAPVASTSLHAQRLGATNMGPRPVADRCKLLALPAEAARQNRVLRAEAMIEIGADGKVSSAVITRSSDWPGFDDEILAAERSCQWIPALVDGKEVASKMKRTFVFNGDKDAPAAPAPQQ